MDFERVLEDGQRAVQGTRSPNGHFASLGDSFVRVWTNLGLLSTIDFRVIVSGRKRRLIAGLADEVYCIGREAIVNAFRHSRATHIETEVEYRPTELRIIVRDNGCGIDPSELGRNGHLGLQEMGERAERIGARLRLWSRVARGTEVELSVPSRVAFEELERLNWRGLRLLDATTERESR